MQLYRIMDELETVWNRSARAIRSLATSHVCLPHVVKGDAKLVWKIWKYQYSCISAQTGTYLVPSVLPTQANPDTRSLMSLDKAARPVREVHVPVYAS